MNETIAQTCPVTFDNVSSVMQTPEMIALLIIIWFVPLLIYIIIGVTARGRSANGAVTSKVMLAYPNSWYAVLVWGLIQLGLFLMLVFPIWLKILK